MASLRQQLHEVKSIATFPGTLWNLLEGIISAIEALAEKAGDPPGSVPGGNPVIEALEARLAALEALAGQSGDTAKKK